MIYNAWLKQVSDALYFENGYIVICTHTDDLSTRQKYESSLIFMKILEIRLSGIFKYLNMQYYLDTFGPQICTLDT